MDEWSSKVKGIIDNHVHMRDHLGEKSILGIAKATGIAKMGLAAIQWPREGRGVPEALFMKARHPANFFVFAGLNHAARLTGGKVAAPGILEQAQNFVRMGCDGIKMLEGKPTSRRELNVPITDPYFAEYWSYVEEQQLPLLWHVNDPEEFWDPATTPGWAKAHNWGYGSEDAKKEALYAEVDKVLKRHPRLRVIFAHFYFLSADLPRAARFLDDHPTVCFDLAPGIEMLYNISRDPADGYDFFMAYADRIVFGTDLASDLTLDEGRARVEIVGRWLETSDEFRVPPEADFLLGPPEDGIIRGMRLGGDAIAQIYEENFVRQVGAKPKKLDKGLAIEECRRIAAISGAMGGTPTAETEAAKVAERLADGS